MKIKIRCSKCGMEASAGEQLFGKTIQCPKCKAPLKVPVPNQAAGSPSQPLAPTTLASVNYQQHAGVKKKRKSSSDLNLILMIVGVAVFALLVGGGIMWALMASGSSEVADTSPLKKGNGAATISAESNTSTGNGSVPATVADKVKITAPWLTFKYAPQKNYIYQLDFVSKDALGVEQTQSCSMILEAAPQKSVESKPQKILYANSYATGLGLPGNRVLVPTETIDKSTSLEIQIGDAAYPAWRGPELGNPDLTLLEYEGPELPPVRVNPFHDFEPNPYVLQRDPMAALYFRGRVRTKPVLKDRPLDELRKQNIDGGLANKVGSSSLSNSTGIAFDRTGTLYGIVTEKETILPTALLESLLTKIDSSLFDETPLPERRCLTEKELTEFVEKNIVSVHAINPPSLDKRFFGNVKMRDSREIACGPYNFGADSFEQIHWTFMGETAFKKGGGTFPYFLGRCSDLIFFNLTAQRSEDWSSDRLVQSNGKARYIAKSKKWPSSSKNIPGSLREEMKITGYDSKIAKISRSISVQFPDLEKFEVPEMWKPGEKDTCIVEATQLINFDHVRGIVLDSTTTGTIEHALDDDEEKEEFEIRVRLAEWKSIAQPKELKPLTKEAAESIVEGLAKGTLGSKSKAIEALAETQPERNESISLSLARHKPLQRGWDSRFHMLAQRWILPEHTETYLKTEGADVRSAVLPEIMRILELRPPVESGKALIRRAIFQPEREEYSLAGRVIRHAYPDMATEVAKALSEATERKRYHGEWIRCIRCVGKSDCVPALEAFIAKLQSMGPRYDADFERYIKYAEEAVEQAKARPADTPADKTKESSS